ncbi:MAG: MATE family efflux transporter [Betaproteobacteria bacterium]
MSRGSTHRPSEHFAAIARLSAPIYVAQIAVFANAVADTIFAGHYHVDHLAAIGLGSAIWASLFLPTMGVLQGLSPIIGRCFGAGDFATIGRHLRAGAWLALALSVPMLIVFAFPEGVLQLAQVPAGVRPLTKAYLHALAFGVPALMLARVFYAFAPAAGHPRAVMVMNVGAMAVKLPLSYALVNGAWGFPELGGPGCGVASAVAYWLMLATAIATLWFDPSYRRFQLWNRSWRFDARTLGAILRLGLPIGASILVEVTSFTFMALFLARLGATVSGAQQIVTNLAALLFMLPLSMGIATQVLISQSLGATLTIEARGLALDGMRLAAACASVVCIGVWLARDWIIGGYTNDPGVARIAYQLFPVLLLFHWFDAQQVTVLQALRGYQQTVVPTLIYAFSLWGIGLGVGYLAAFAPWPAIWPNVPLGAIGLWWAQTASLAVAGAALFWEFRRISRPGHVPQ